MQEPVAQEFVAQESVVQELVTKDNEDSKSIIQKPDLQEYKLIGINVTNFILKF